MDNAIIKMLRCPVCDAKMTANDNLRLCHCMGQKAHSFDFSRSGYLNLGGAHAGEGDKKPAIIARRKFLDFGYYSKLSDKINDILDSLPSKQVLDAGCGEGYYTNRMAQGRSVLGIDLSKDGIDYGARRAKQLSMTANVGFAVASVFNIPVSDAQMDVVVNIFAPCAEDEYCRVLKPGGYLLLVGAGEQHLMGLKTVLYENPYTNPGRTDLPQKMTLIEKFRLQTEITVIGTEMIDALFSMTPYYWRTSMQDRQKLIQLHALTTELDFDIFLFRKDK